MTGVRGWKLARRVGLVVVLAALLYYVVTFVQVWWAARGDDTRRSEAIVVLGAAQFNGRPSAVFKARLDHAAALYHDRVAPLIVVTGGKQIGDQFTEATSGANYLHGKGVPDAAILRETTSRTSWESLAAAAHVLEDRGAKDVVLVSDPFHALRIRSIANELGLDAVTSPTRTSPISGFDEWRRFMSEAMRVAAGRIVGFGRLARGTDRVGRLVPGLGTMALPSGVV
ncbi:MAG TPA: YdcF family protein [Acidimicrobiia bacterium]|nr:YdcF family protein [Acidimicrobiia bacterium]